MRVQTFSVMPAMSSYAFVDNNNNNNNNNIFMLLTYEG
jgi:hypothetical protein